VIYNPHSLTHVKLPSGYAAMRRARNTPCTYVQITCMHTCSANSRPYVLAPSRTCKYAVKQLLTLRCSHDTTSERLQRNALNLNEYVHVYVSNQYLSTLRLHEPISPATVVRWGSAVVRSSGPHRPTTLTRNWIRRDPADFGYWQLRSLALRAEAVATPPAGDDWSNAMPPRLCEQDWDEEKSESWEDEDMWLQVVDADDAEMATPTTDDLRDGSEPQRYGGSVQRTI